MNDSFSNSLLNASAFAEKSTATSLVWEEAGAKGASFQHKPCPQALKIHRQLPFMTRMGSLPKVWSKKGAVSFAETL